MKQRPVVTLDSFETALLCELQATIDHPSAADSNPRAIDGSARWQQKRRWQVTGAAAAAAAGLVLLVPALAPTPAYAVTGRNGGEVHVKVNRLKGADGLERALAKHGIAADINYLPPNKECAGDRYVAVRARGLMLSVGDRSFEVTIPAGVVAEGDTFVLDASVAPRGNGVQVRVAFDIAHGAIAPCEMIDGP